MALYILWGLLCGGIALYDIKFLKIPPLGATLFFVIGITYAVMAYKSWLSVLIPLSIVATACGILLIYMPKALGIGDMKLLCGSALFLPFHQIPLFFIVAGFLGVAFHILVPSDTNKRPFSACIMMSLHLCMLWQHQTFI